MKTEDLKIFLHLASSLSFIKTSQEHFMSPSTLSRVIKRLEEEVGHQLFERDNRSVTLTEKGGIFRNYAIETVSGWEGIRAALDQEEGLLRGVVKIYGSVTSAYSMLPGILSQFRSAYPQIRLELAVGPVRRALHKIETDEIDVAVGALPVQPNLELLRKILAVTPMVFIAPLELAHLIPSSDPNKIDWGSTPLILLKSGSARSQLNYWFQQKQIQPNLYGEVESNEAIITLTCLGCGIGFLPRLVLEKSPLRSEVRILNIKHDIEDLTVSIVMKTSKLEHPRLRVFWETLSPGSGKERERIVRK